MPMSALWVKHEPSPGPRAVATRQTVERYLSLPFYVTAAILRELGIEAERPDETRDEAGLRMAATIKERGLLSRFAEAVEREWSKWGAK
jgi:hypothetical protein